MRPLDRPFIAVIRKPPDKGFGVSFPDLPKMPVAAKVKRSICRRGRTENGLVEWAAFDEHRLSLAGPHDVNDALFVDAEQQAARDHE